MQFHFGQFRDSSRNSLSKIPHTAHFMLTTATKFLENKMKVQFSENEVKTMQTALDQWGLKAQVGQTIEECAELIVALQKYINRTPQPDMVLNIIDEIADVEMMLAQMRLILKINDETLRNRIEQKFERLNEYLAKDRV